MNKFATAAIGLILVSCSPRLVGPSSRSDSSSARVDSVYVRDSVYIDRYKVVKQAGDTIYVQTFIDRYRDRWRVKEVHDTLRLKETVTEIQQVPAELTFWQRMWIWLGKVLTGIAGAVLAVFAVKLVLKLRGVAK